MNDNIPGCEDILGGGKRNADQCLVCWCPITAESETTTHASCGWTACRECFQSWVSRCPRELNCVLCREQLLIDGVPRRQIDAMKQELVKAIKRYQAQRIPLNDMRPSHPPGEFETLAALNRDPANSHLSLKDLISKAAEQSLLTNASQDGNHENADSGRTTTSRASEAAQIKAENQLASKESQLSTKLCLARLEVTRLNLNAGMAKSDFEQAEKTDDFLTQLIRAGAPLPALKLHAKHLMSVIQTCLKDYANLEVQLQEMSSDGRQALSKGIRTLPRIGEVRRS